MSKTGLISTFFFLILVSVSILFMRTTPPSTAMSPMNALPSFKFPWDGADNPWYYTGGPHGYNDRNPCTEHPISDPSSSFSLSGIDVTKAAGRGVLAMAGGRVIQAGWRSDAWGYTVEIDHSGNCSLCGYQTMYAHLRDNPQTNPGISVGMTVSQGTVIGIVGQSGGVPPHLHIELKSGGSPVTWDGVVIDGWRIRAIRNVLTPTIGFNYQGTATLGPEAEQSQRWCGKAAAVTTGLYGVKYADEAGNMERDLHSANFPICPGGTIAKFGSSKENIICYEPSSPVDVYLLVDLSGSFEDDLPVFKAQAPGAILTSIESNPNTRFGLGKFEDYPIYPFGSISYGDKAYERLVDLTFDTDKVLNTISGLFTRNGQDWPESQLSALYQAATGEGQDLSEDGFPEASIPSGQQAHFREEAIKIFLLWTDADFHYPEDKGVIPYPGPSFIDVIEAIDSLPGDSPWVVGIDASGLTGLSTGQGSQEQFLENAETDKISTSDGLSDLKAIAAATGALAPAGGVDCNNDGIIDIAEGEPLVCTIASTGEGIGEAIIALVEAATKPSILYLPVVLKNFDASSPPPITTPTHTPTPTATPTSTPTPFGQPPAVPSNLQATPLDSNSIRLDWVDNSNNESGFVIYVGATFVTTVEADTTSYTVEGLGINSYNCYHMYAFNDFGLSSWTDWACAVTTGLPLTGTVTDNGITVGGTEIQLQFYNGSIWSTYATTTTDASGNYQFLYPPLLGGEQSLYILWFNNDNNASRLASWSCFSVTWFTTEPSAYQCNFDLDNVDLLSPISGATVSLPSTFIWSQRFSPTESYELNLADISDYNSYWWTGPLGYVDRYTLNGLPSGFVPDQQYDWWMWVYGPDGYGISNYSYSITFSNEGARLEVEQVPLPAGISKEDVEMIAPSRSR